MVPCLPSFGFERLFTGRMCFAKALSPKVWRRCWGDLVQQVAPTPGVQSVLEDRVAISSPAASVYWSLKPLAFYETRLECASDSGHRPRALCPVPFPPPSGRRAGPGLFPVGWSPSPLILVPSSSFSAWISPPPLSQMLLDTHRIHRTTVAVLLSFLSVPPCHSLDQMLKPGFSP